ncbi:MAG: hypothetical protein ACJASM_002874 [Salibacteraceae bacterium]|jgi:hypothetical protein
MDIIEFKLKTDKDGNEVQLDNMSLSSTKAVRAILDALINIVEFEKDLDLKIGIEKGSATQRILSENTEDLAVVYNKIKNVANGSPNRQKTYVSQLNVIYDNFREFGDYEASYRDELKVEDLKPLFQNKFKRFRSSGKLEQEFRVRFFNAELEQNGGVKPNFHISENNKRYTIQCSKEEAQKVNAFLYKDVMISTWEKRKKYTTEYKFCDIYAGNSVNYYDDFEAFFDKLKWLKGPEPFSFISDKLCEYYDQQDLAGARKFIRIFINPLSPPIYLRTILMFSKAFREEETLKESLDKIENLLSNKVGKVY